MPIDFTILCACCKGDTHLPGQSYCRFCKNWKARDRKPYAEFTPEERKKVAARNAAWYAVNTGRIPRNPCEIAGCQAKAEKHHDNYDRPLDVRWLCARHHRDLHKHAIHPAKAEISTQTQQDGAHDALYANAPKVQRGGI